MGCCNPKPAATYDPGNLYPGQGSGPAHPPPGPYGYPAMPPPPPGYTYGQPAHDNGNENMALGVIGGAAVGGALMGGGVDGMGIGGGYHLGPRMGF